MTRTVEIKVTKPFSAEHPIVKALVKKKQIKFAIQQGATSEDLVKRGLIK